MARFTFVLFCLIIGLGVAAPASAQYRSDGFREDVRHFCERETRTERGFHRCMADQGSRHRNRSYASCDQRSYQYQSGCYNRPPAFDRNRAYRPRYPERRYSYGPPRGYGQYTPRSRYAQHRHGRGCRSRGGIHFHISL